ncbi:MAG: hypothetical protein ACI9YH_004066 [Colwellia sp.]|jgi:hypothetical protein
MRILVFQLSIYYGVLYSFDPNDFISCNLNKTYLFSIIMPINLQVNVMLESKSDVNKTNLEKGNDASPYIDEKLITTDTFNIKTLKLDSLENESTSYVLGYN